MTTNKRCPVLERKHPKTVEELLGHLANAIAFNFLLSDTVQSKAEAQEQQEKLNRSWAQQQERPLFNRSLIPARGARPATASVIRSNFALTDHPRPPLSP